MGVSRRALLGLVAGLPLALKALAVEPAKKLGPVNRERFFNGAWIEDEVQGEIRPCWCAKSRFVHARNSGCDFLQFQDEIDERWRQQHERLKGDRWA